MTAMALGNPRNLWLFLTFLLAVLATMLVVKAWPVLFPLAEQRLAPDPACDLRGGPCVTHLPGGGELHFAITPEKIPLLKPLRLQVSVQGVEVDGVEVDFAGVDMYMGYNRVPLQREKPGRYLGEGRLPVCVREAMEWEARVMLDTPRGIISVPHRFVTIKE